MHIKRVIRNIVKNTKNLKIIPNNMNKLQNEDGNLEIDDLVQSRDLNADQISEIKAYLDKYPKLKLRVVSQNDDYVNIIIKSYNDVPLDAVARIIDTAVEELNDYEVFIGGVPYVNGVISALIRDDVIGLVRIGMLVMILILFFSLRSFPAVLMVLSVIFLSVIAMMGSMGWVLEITGSRRFVFSLINTSMPIILLTIANSDGVHIITKFFKKLRQSGDTQLAVEQTMESLTLPIFLTSITTAAAFLSMIYSPLEVQTGYGVTIAIGIFWALVLSYTLLPSLLVLKKWNLDSKAVRETSFLENVIDRCGKGVLENPKRVLSSGLILVFIGLIGINWLSVEVNMQSFFKKGTTVRETMEFLDREMIGSLDMQFRFEGDMKEPETLAKIERLQNKMEENQEVTTSMYIADAIKQMHRTVLDDDPDYETIPDTRGKVNNLFTLYAMSGDPDDFSSLVDYEYSSGLMTTFMRNMTSSLIIEYVLLNLAWILALAVPMAVLVSTLMAFGRLSADNEITAMRSVSVSYLRLLFPVIIFGISVTGIMMYFNNQILPEMNHKARKLSSDISRKRPGLTYDIGVFIECLDVFKLI